MKRFRIWPLRKAIALCNFGLKHYSDGAEDQTDINEVVTTKNKFIRELKSLES